MRQFTKIAIAVAIVAVFGIAQSCSEQQDVAPATSNKEVSDEVRQGFKNLGFDVSDMRLIDKTNPLTGETKKQYLLEGDIAISPEDFQQMLKSKVHHVGAVGEQYCTYNLVSSPRTISVIGYTGSGYALSSAMRTALQYAVDNYNALGIGLYFTLSFSSSTNADIVVYQVSGAAGGLAGFPSGGYPYKWIELYSGLNSYDINTIEHVATHEIGHCVGLRHTDWYNRSLSCGSGGNEGSGGVGAYWIPGTPSGYDGSSVMLACFSYYETGEFGYYDQVALHYLY